jgi:prolyl 4-hydroxylase
MSNYGLGGHYEAHYDYDENRYSKPSISKINFNKTGDRLATFMLYLTEVKRGGATVFPRLNITSTPIKNAAIFWYNYRRNGEQETLSVHAGCPVILGEKWVSNKWIREFSQEFRRPCLLDPNV